MDVVEDMSRMCCHGPKQFKMTLPSSQRSFHRGAVDAFFPYPSQLPSFTTAESLKASLAKNAPPCWGGRICLSSFFPTQLYVLQTKKTASAILILPNHRQRPFMTGLPWTVRKCTVEVEAQNKKFANAT